MKHLIKTIKFVLICVLTVASLTIYVTLLYLAFLAGWAGVG